MYNVSSRQIGLTKELNVKGIAITRPGEAYSEINFGANLLHWAQHDVKAVLDFRVPGLCRGRTLASTANLPTKIIPTNIP